MKINSQVLYRQIVDSLAKKNVEFYYANEKLTTLKKLNRPSEDVPSYIKAEGYKTKLSTHEQFKRNIDIAEGTLKFVEDQISNLSDILDRVLELALNGLNATEDSFSRKAIGEELTNIVDFIQSIANSNYEGNYVFSGFKSQQKPFPSIDEGYNGDSNGILVEIDNESFMEMNITGDKIFLFNDFPSTSITTEDGKRIYYNANVDGSLSIEIRESDNVTVVKNFNIKNVMDSIKKMAEAFKKNDLVEARAFSELINFIKDKVVASHTEIGAKLSRLERQREVLDESENIYKKLLSEVQDADVAEVASIIANIQTSLEALRLSASKIFSQSLFDFLR